jgi:trehalose 6-phosphate synthase
MADTEDGELAGPPRALVLVSNRGPVEHLLDDQGRRTTKRGAGGLVTALSDLASLTDAVWVCNAITPEDTTVAREHGHESFPLEDGERRYRLRLVEQDPDEYQRFYSIVANPMLWFVQHYLWDLSNVPDITANELEAFKAGYVPVNERLAEAIAEEVARSGGAARVMMHDYHLYLVPSLVRQRCPDAFLHHFIHIPWPQPDAWRVLPARLREPMLRGLLANDVVAFHTERYARNFLLTCQELLDLPVSFSDFSVTVGSHTLAARWYPISIDAAALEAEAASETVAESYRRLQNMRREYLILRVDRTDLSKNILRGFKAFRQLLRDHPELTGRVTFLALLQPSRQDVDEYIEYLEKIRRLVADINLERGNADWQPIDLRVGDFFPQTVAAYKLFDVLVVNPVFDGLNLVAKEGMLINEHDGVLVLSEHAGVHAELGAFAISVHPFDIGAQAEALWRALTMGADERRARRDACAEVIRSNDIRKWLQEQLNDIATLEAGMDRPAAPARVAT